MSTVTIGVIVGIILLVLLLAFFMKRYLQTRRHRVRAATWKGSTMSCRKTTAGTKRKMPKLDEINRAYHEGGDCSAEGSDSLEWHMRHSGGSKQGSVTKALDKVRQTIGGKVPEHKMSLSRHDSAAEGMGRDNDDDLEMGTMPDAVRSRGHRGSLIAFTDGMAIPAPPAPPAIEPSAVGARASATSPQSRAPRRRRSSQPAATTSTRRTRRTGGRLRASGGSTWRAAR